MAMDFPASPTVGQTFTSGAVTYVWNGTGWAVQATSGAYVLKAGDTMTGNLLINSSTTPQIKVVSTGTAVVRLESGVGGQCGFNGFRNGLQRWGVLAGTNDTESGSNTGSSFAVVRCNDAGNQLDYPIWIDRSTGIVTGTGLVNYTAQTLTAPQQTQARVNVYAAPADALGWSGMQINGSMEVSQENGATGVALVGSSAYIVDNWQAARAISSGTLTAAQTTVTNPPFKNSLLLYATSAVTTVAAGDYANVQQLIEGTRWRRLGFGGAGASPVTIGFWAASANNAGVMSVGIRNGTYNRSYITTVNLAAGVFNYYTVTIPGDTAGTWATDNTPGAVLSFCALSGSTFATSSVNAWQAGNFVAASGQQNFCSAINGGVYIYGVVVLPGVEAPSAARSPFIMRPFDQELVTCMRYYEKLNNLYQGYVAGGTLSFSVQTPWKVYKRVTPTLTGVNINASAFPATAGTLTADGAAGAIETRTSTALSNTGFFQSTITGDARL